MYFLCHTNNHSDMACWLAGEPRIWPTVGPLHKKGIPTISANLVYYNTHNSSITYNINITNITYNNSNTGITTLLSLPLIQLIIIIVV